MVSTDIQRLVTRSTRGHGLAVALAITAGVVLVPAALARSVQDRSARQTGTPTFTASVYTGLDRPVVEALLYNPPMDAVPWTLPYEPTSTMRHVTPVLVLYGRGLPDGSATVTYRIEETGRVRRAGTTKVAIARGGFEAALTLDAKYPQATHVAYVISAEGRPPLNGRVALHWSRFRGQVRYLDGGWRSSFVELWPNGFRAPGTFYVPVTDDGRFDALLPARVYSVLNVNGAGYKYDTMERWGWDYDLTRDREEVFTIGRAEIYAMRAFDLNAPLSTTFVMFRPTALSRVLRFDLDGDGLISEAETRATLAAMKDSPTVIGPELEAADVTVWLNGREEKIVRFDRIPEFDGAYWQVQYLLQIYPEPRPPRGVWHEIRVEVRSRETLRGRTIVDFGQGSVGFQRY